VEQGRGGAQDPAHAALSAGGAADLGCVRLVVGVGVGVGVGAGVGVRALWLGVYV